MSLSKQAAVAGAPGVLTITDVAGKSHTFVVSKPSANDLILMQRWVLSQPLGGETQGISDKDLDGLSPERQVILLREYAKSKGGKRSPTEAECVALLYSPPGVAMQVWLAVRRGQPGITREAVAALITSENADQVAIDLDEALGAKLEGSDPKAQDGPAS